MLDAVPARRARAARACALVLLAVGCARFQPVTPLRAQSGSVTMELKYLRLGPLGEMVFAASSPEARDLSQAWFTVATRSPCTGGDELDDMRVDGRASAWLPAGEHELSLWPRSGGLEFGLDTVVDIRSDAGCIRVPAVSQSIPIEVAARPDLLVTTDVLYTPMPSGLRSLIGFQLGVGQWVGPVQLIAAAGFGGAVCQEWACGHDAQNNLRDGASIPLSLEARYAFGTARVRQFLNIGFLEARALVTPYWLPLPGGDQRFTATSAFVALGWAFLEVPPGPWRHLERAPHMELAIPVGITTSSGGTGPRTAFSGGMTVRFVFSL